jgi:hypothetical protein
MLKNMRYWRKRKRYLPIKPTTEFTIWNENGPSEKKVQASELIGKIIQFYRPNNPMPVGPRVWAITLENYLRLAEYAGEFGFSVELVEL